MGSEGRGVLQGAFALLAALEQAEDGLGLTALAAASGLPKTTTHRLVEQLLTLGAVERHGRRYRLGARIFTLGQAWQPHPRLRVSARHPVRRLAAVTQSGVMLSVLFENRVLVLAADGETVTPLRPGTTFPLETAAGKALVGGPGVGVTLEREEVMPNVACVAAPVFSPIGQIVASVSVVIGADRKFAPLVEAVRHAARVIAHGLVR